jgi:MFS family permease
MALTLAFSAGCAAAPAVSTFIADTVGWRWSFLPQVILAAALLPLTRLVPATPTRPRLPIDWPGAAMALAGAALILGGATLADEYGWWEAAKTYLILGTWPWPFSLSIAPVFIVTGAILIGVWLYRRRRRRAQLRVSPFRAGTLARRSFFATVVTAAVHNVAIGGLMFALFVYIPLVFSLKSLATTIAILPFSLATLVASVLMPLVSRWLAPKRLLQAGLVVGGAGALVLLGAISLEGTLLGLVPGLILMGLGAGLVYGQTPKLVIASTADEPSEDATGISNSMQMLGSSVGTALIGAILMVSASAFLVHSVADQLGAVLAPERQHDLILQISDTLRTLKRDEVRELVAQLPTAVRDAVVSTARDAAVNAMRVTLVAIVASLVLALGISVIVPQGEDPPVKSDGGPLVEHAAPRRRENEDAV